MNNFFSWLVRGDTVDQRRKIVVKCFKSKGPKDIVVPLTVADVQRGFVFDSYGYKNEIVLFLRKDKKDRL